MITKQLCCSTIITYGKMLRYSQLRLCVKNNFKIMQALNYSKAAVYKSQLDPKIDKIKDLILYSDYLEKRKFKLGYRINMAIYHGRRHREKERKENELLNTPAISVALKYLDNVQTVSEAMNSDSTSTNSQQKPLYMPYAAEDKVELAQVNEMTNEENNEETDEEVDNNILNEKYKILCEEHFKETSSKHERTHTQWQDNLSNVPDDWMTDYEIFDNESEKFNNEDPWQMKYGTPEPNSTISSIPCGGCGALLHCKDPAIPGYLPSELFIYKREEELKSFICQRCHFIKNYNVALDVKVSSDEYCNLIKQIKGKKAAVILIVDLTDFPCSIWPNLPDLIGKQIPIFLVGNKVDLLPQDSGIFFEHVKNCLLKATVEAGVNEKNIRHIALISAKSNYGIEELINKLWDIWEYKGDVYLIGCTNVGKSSLFNALLQSDYCKVQAADLVQRATVSPWPGTTLNLLKFPLLRPNTQRKLERMDRLRTEHELKSMEQYHRKLLYTSTKDKQFATLQGRIGRSFWPPYKNKTHKMDYTKNEDIFTVSKTYQKEVQKKQFGLDEEGVEYRNSKWCYDTPGTVQPDQVLHFLTTEELIKTLPKQIISPRTFLFKPNFTLFLAGLGRLDYIEGPQFIRCTVFASDELPVTMCALNNADTVYNELLYTDAFVVPVSDAERLKLWPEMQSKEFIVNGIHHNESAADIVLSSAGWISVTPNTNEQVVVRAWTPEGRGLYMRTPALLRKSVSLRGARIHGTPAYRASQIIIKS